MYTDLHTHCHQYIHTKAYIQLQQAMHNGRSLPRWINFHLSGSVEARANLCRAAPSYVTHVCLVIARGILDNTGKRRLLGVMARLILYTYMHTCVDTYTHTNTYTYTKVQAYHCLSSSSYWQTI